MGDALTQGLGQAVGVLAAIESLRRPGGLGDYFTNRLAVRNDPDARAGLVDNPFTAGFFGVPGGRQMIPVDMPAVGGMPSPSAPERVAQWQPTLPPLGANAILGQQGKQVDMALKLAQLGLTNQKATSAADFAKFLGGGEAGAAPGGPGNMQMTGFTVGADGQPRLSFGPPPSTEVPTGAIDPSTGEPYKPGAKTPSGKVVDVVKPAPNAVSLQNQLRRLNSARSALQSAFGPGKDGSSPFDLLPSANESLGAGYFRQNEYTRPFTSAGEIPGFVGGESIPRAARQGDARALVLTTGTVQRVGLARAFGEVGPLTEQEQKVVEQLLPSKDDTREIAEQKYRYALALLDNLEAGLKAGTLNQDDAKAALLGAASGQTVAPTTPGQPAPAKPAARTPYDPAADLEFLGLKQ